MIDNDNTAEQLRERELFEEGVKKWPNYSDRTLIRDGRYPDYYGNPVVQGAWEGFKLGRSTRADSGEAVAWRWRDDVRPGLPWRTTTNDDFVAHLRDKGGYDIKPLFTRDEVPYCKRCGDGIIAADPGLCGTCLDTDHPRATSVDVLDADRYRELCRQMDEASNVSNEASTIRNIVDDSINLGSACMDWHLDAAIASHMDEDGNEVTI